MTVAGVLAHQGGWDEILLVLTPVAMFAGLLWLANRRADAQLADRADGSEDGDPTDGDDGDGSPSGSGPPSEADGPRGDRSP